MSERKYWNFASCWQSKKNADIITVKVDDSDDSVVEIFAIHKPTGKKIKLENFFLKRNASKDKPDANPMWPDFQATFTTGD